MVKKKEMDKKGQDNPLVRNIINYRYKDEKINEHIKIYKKTKKERIKNKKFVQMLPGAIKERKEIRVEEVVLLDIEVYQKMMEHINAMEKDLGVNKE